MCCEFGIEVEIIACKRLGRVQFERRRPILVVCKSADYVANVLACAKLLRNSADPEIKRMVFINSNLTKGQEQLMNCAASVGCRHSAVRRSDKWIIVMLFQTRMRQVVYLLMITKRV